MTQQPALDGRSFVGGVIVDDQVERAAARDLVVNRFKELAELHRPMAVRGDLGGWISSGARAG